MNALVCARGNVLGVDEIKVRFGIVVLVKFEEYDSTLLFIIFYQSIVLRLGNVQYTLGIVREGQTTSYDFKPMQNVGMCGIHRCIMHFYNRGRAVYIYYLKTFCISCILCKFKLSNGQHNAGHEGGG